MRAHSTTSGGREGTKAVKHAAIYLVARGLPGIVAFLAIPVFTRLLDPSGYGKYALVSATVGLLNALLFQWLRLGLVRFLPAYDGRAGLLKSALLSSELILSGALGLVAAACLAIPALAPWRAMIFCCWALLFIQALFELFLEHARAKLEPWHYMVLLLTRSLIGTALGAGLILLGMGWWGPVVAAGVAMLLAGVYAYARDWRDACLRIDRQSLRALCVYGLPLSVTVALTLVISTSDRFLIAGFLGEDAAGLYSVAVDFTSQTLTLLMMVINLAMFPLAVRAWEREGREAAQEQMRHNASLLLAVGVPAVVALCVLAPSIAHTFLGKGFRSAASAIIPLVALGSFLAGLKAYHFDAAFQFVHRTIQQVWIVLAAAMVNVALNLLVIRRFGINGAAGASVVAYVVSIALTVWVGRKHIALPFPLRQLTQVVLASACMAAGLFSIRGYRGATALTAQCCSGAAIYAAVLMSFNYLGVRDWLLRLAVRSPGPADDAPQSAEPNIAELA